MATTLGSVRRIVFAVIAVCFSSTIALAEAPTAAEIESAVNEGVDLNYHLLQSVTDTRILKGGETTRGDFLYLCDASLVWDIGSAELIESFRNETEQAEFPEALQQFLPMAEIVTAALRNQLGTFEAGDVVHSIRMRVRLESAGDDWIVTQLETVATELRGNPLDSFNAAGESRIVRRPN